MKKSVLILALVSVSFLFTNCSKDNEFDRFADVTLDQIGTNGDISGVFTGNSGSFSKTYTWQNAETFANYSADITAVTTGLFTMTVKDAAGATVLERSIYADTSSDTFSGITFTGTPGEWTVTITLNDFDGDGSFSLSVGEGN